MATDATKATRPDWHSLEPSVALERLDVRAERGLTGAEAAQRRGRHGENLLVEGKRRGPLRMLLDQFTDFMVIVLIGAAFLSAFLGEAEDTIAIVVIVALNATLGFVQEYRAERAMAALRALAAPQAHVLRDGGPTTVASRELVPGDVVLLEAGNLVPADLRLVESAGLRVDEASLTGESVPVEKGTSALPAGERPLGDRTNMAYKGTLAVAGRGAGVVVDTGMRTELGRIADLLHREEGRASPLQQRLARFGRRLALVVLVLCAGMMGVGVAQGGEPLLMFMTALSLAVAAIPEALPAVVTVSLALGARKMVRHEALVRRLPAVETLGSVTYICSDKTGTLTRNRMEVEAILSSEDPDGPDVLRGTLLDAVALCNDAVRTPEGMRGDPTEVALYEAAERASAAASALPRTAELPFSSERASMSTLHRLDDGSVAVYTKGAPERVLPLCVAQLGPEGPVPAAREALLARADQMARDGLRVLAFATRSLPELPGSPTPEGVEAELTFLGLVGMLDPPREEAAEAVRICQAAGIHVVMITGDHPATGATIARRLGIARSEAEVLTGTELDAMTDEALAERVTSLRVYARVAPEQKIRIVAALQARGEFVAMTGDGVNDAPALRRADIGVAMGRAGTDVAREAAAMVLLDDDFSTIVGAVREGRRIFDNIRKFVRYTLTSNSGEIWALFLAPLIGLPIPLLPIHILWVNLVTDGLPGLALTVEPGERGLMARPPRPPDESIFAHGLGVHSVWVGLLMGGVTLAVQAWAWSTGNSHWQSMAFTVLTLSQMGHVLAVRSERESFFALGPLSNLPLLGAVLLTFALQLATLYVPALREVFRTDALDTQELAICLAASSVVFFAVEIEKLLVRRGLIRRG